VQDDKETRIEQLSFKNIFLLNSVTGTGVPFLHSQAENMQNFVAKTLAGIRDNATLQYVISRGRMEVLHLICDCV